MRRRLYQNPFPTLIPCLTFIRLLRLFLIRFVRLFSGESIISNILISSHSSFSFSLSIIFFAKISVAARSLISIAFAFNNSFSNSTTSTVSLLHSRPFSLPHSGMNTNSESPLRSFFSTALRITFRRSHPFRPNKS